MYFELSTKAGHFLSMSKRQQIIALCYIWIQFSYRRLFYFSVNLKKKICII